jgi:hypothetical protein
MQTFFNVEITDTFAGEANYSWITRHKVKANTIQGAISKVAKDSGLSFRKTITGEVTRYDSKSGATCAFVEEWDDSIHADQKHSLALA